MKTLILVLMMFLAQVVHSGLPPQANLPLTKAQVMDLVKFGMDSTALAGRIKEHGIDFEPTSNDLESLRQAGAQEPVILALREARPKPLSREQVGELVAGGVPCQHALALIQQHGIDFLVDDPYLGTLRVAGADEELIAALRDAGGAGELRVVTVPGAWVFLDGKFQGWANQQGEFTVISRLGVHALKVSQRTRRPFEQSVTLTSGQEITLEAPLVDNAPGEMAGKPKPASARNREELVAFAQSAGRDYAEFDLTGKTPRQQIGKVVIELIETKPEAGSFTVLLLYEGKRAARTSSINEPAYFNLSGVPGAYELVVNKLGKDAISGYLTAPKGVFQ